MADSSRLVAPGPPAGGEAPRPAVRTGASFIRLIYSFALEEYEDESVRRSSAIDVLPCLKERAGASGWRDRRIVDDYVLPHLADHVNAADPRRSDAEVGHWWRYAEPFPRRWTLRAKAARRLDLDLDGIDFVFFRTGIGMLILDVSPVSDDLADWQDVLHLARFYRLPEVAIAGGGPDPHDRSTFTRRAVVVAPSTDDPSHAGWAPGASRRPLGFGHVVDGLLTDLFGDRSWDQASVPGLLTPFSAFFVDGLDDERRRFETAYRWRRQLRSGATVAATDHGDLHAELRHYAAGMWLAYSTEGGGFLAVDAPHGHFFEHELTDHLRRPYLLGYLLALHQRLALSRFSQRIAHVVANSRGQWTSDQPPRDEIARLQDDFLEYLTRCHFAQVFRTTNHHANYKAWEEALEVGVFAQEVEVQLHHLHERSIIADRIIDEHRRARQSGRVNAAVLGITLPTVVLAILAVAYPLGLGLGTTVGLAAGSTALGAVTGWLTTTYRPAERGRRWGGRSRGHGTKQATA